MGRIEEALRRAAAEKDPSDEGAQTPRRQEGVDSPFVSAWQFEARSEKPGSEAPVAAPRKVAADRVAGPPLRVGAHPARTSQPVPSVGLESQLEMSWPQPFAPEVAEKLVVMREANASAVEQYRRLAETLHQIQRERGAKIVIVASAIAGEGKTLTAANLALTLSESYRRRVLLIDTALRQPRLHQMFQVSAVSGLSDTLRSASKENMPVIALTRRLVLLPAGRAAGDQVGALGSGRMRQVLVDAAASFDWVILDSAPIVEQPETSDLAAMVDVALLVINAGKTPHELVLRAVDALGRDRLAGVVLNRVDDSLLAPTSGLTRAERYRADSPLAGDTEMALAD